MAEVYLLCAFKNNWLKLISCQLTKLTYFSGIYGLQNPWKIIIQEVSL